MKNSVLIDFETASTCDLLKAGAWRYAEDPNTEVLCLCWINPKTRLRGHWAPGMDPAELMAIASDPDILVIAHNAGFEKAIWRRIMVPILCFPDIPDDRWHDTMAVCAEKGLPQKLERVVPVLGLPGEKDTVGSRFTIALSKPNKKTGMYDRSPATIERVLTYCDSDCDNELLVHKRVGWQEKSERQVWLLDQEINQRGVRLDMGYVRACQRIVTEAQEPMLRQFKELTGLKPGQAAKVRDWCAGHGSAIPNLQKETIVNWLGTDIDGSEPNWDEITALPILAPEVREVLSIRQIVGSSSVKKLSSMEQCVGGDGRVRGVLQYHGAGPGRWAGRLFQPQNFPRPTLMIDDKFPASDIMVQAIMTGDWEYVNQVLGPPVETVVSGLRHAIVASPGHVLVAGDFSGIEARVVLALAGQFDKCELLAQGLDPYCDFASTALGRPITKKDNPVERQNLGKPGVLGCGFQMGWRKLMLKYGVPAELAQLIVNAYRKEWAPLVPKVWYGLEGAAVQTVHTGKPHEAFGVLYALEDGWLTARLPSGRKLWYWDPRPIRKAMPWDETDIRQGFTYRAYKQGHMVTVNAYGGLLTENVVQGLARDLLVASMFRLRKNGFPIILTVHDENLCEVLEALADEKAFRQIMNERDPWAVAMGIPIETETWVNDCYRK